MLTDQQVRVYVRWMIRRDLPEVLAIEAKANEYGWCEEDFVAAMRQRNCIGLVAEQGDKVLGFVIYELHKHKLHILNLAVTKGMQRNGVGTQILNKLISKLSGDKRNHITLDLRESALSAQLFFKAMGFQALRVLRAFYDDSGEDAYSMRYALSGADIIEEPVELAPYAESEEV